MSKTSLGRVLDPEALAAGEGPRARLRIEVPAAFLDAGAAIELTAPTRLACARCEGGGCDGCSRSGALRAPDAAPDRTLVARLPSGARGPLILRLSDPFGPVSVIRQLLLEVRIAALPSAGVRRLADPPGPSGAPTPPRIPPPIAGRWPAITAALIALAAITAILLDR